MEPRSTVVFDGVNVMLVPVGRSAKEIYTCNSFTFVHKQVQGCLHSFSNRIYPNSDQHQNSPCHINAYSIPEVMRIEDMITQGARIFLRF